jgi:pimeloyl-ACP methyl ester carboxylesterase
MKTCNSEGQHLEVTGGQIFVRRWTPQSLVDQVPVVLLHDSLGCVQMWRDFPALLACRLNKQVIAYDRLGFGQSSPRDSPLPLDFIDEEALTIFPDLCASLNLNRVILFGHSVGGGMAIAIASHHAQTELCTAVITVSALAFLENQSIEGIRAAKAKFDDPVQLSKLAAYHGSKAQWVLDAWTETWLAPGLSDWSLDPYLKQVRCPVQAIHGNQDQFGSCESPRLIADGVKAYAEAVILDGFGHVPHRENPERILDTVERFLTRVQSGVTLRTGI